MEQLRKALTRPQFRFGVGVLLPIVAWYVLFSFRPVVQGLRMALIDYNLLNPDASQFVGLEHFRTILTGYELFWIAARNTLVFAAMLSAAMLPLALLLAYCLATVRRGRAFYQWALFVPVVVSMAAMALLWRFLMNPTGILNSILVAVGLGPSGWLTSPKTALPSLALIELWKALGGNVVILTAGLLAIPVEFYDAARVDGAGAWQTFWRVTLPLLGHTLKLVAVLILIGSLQTYTSAVILTGGGPARATYMISQFVVSEALVNFRFGLAAAAASLLFALIFGATLAQLRLMRARWEY